MVPYRGVEVSISSMTFFLQNALAPGNGVGYIPLIAAGNAGRGLRKEPVRGAAMRSGPLRAGVRV
jgi:hypothetical protein